MVLVVIEEDGMVLVVMQEEDGMVLVVRKTAWCWW